MRPGNTVWKRSSQFPAVPTLSLRIIPDSNKHSQRGVFMPKHCSHHVFISEKDLNFLNGIENTAIIFHSLEFQCYLWEHSEGSHWAAAQQYYREVGEKFVPGWWVVWNGTEYTMLIRDSCPTIGEDGEMCVLPIDHSVSHKWLE